MFFQVCFEVRVLSNEVFYAKVSVNSIVSLFPIFVPPTFTSLFNVTHFAPPFWAFWTDVLEVILGVFLFAHKNARDGDNVQMRAF